MTGVNIGASEDANGNLVVVADSSGTVIAKEGGNLATIATAQGAGATGIAQPTGGSGILGWLSGIFNKLNTSIAVTIGSLPLPTGASTSALQTTGNTSLSSIDVKTPALGQTTAANSSPIAIASDQLLPAAANPQNKAALPVSDTTQFEGLSMIEIMAQILTELKIQSQYLYDLPYLLNESFPNHQSEDPAALRDSGTLYS